MKNISLVVILGIVVIAGVTIYSQKQNADAPTADKMEQHIGDAMEMEKDSMEKDDVMEKSDTDAAMVKDETAMMDSDDVMVKGTDEVMEQKPGSFVDYNDVDIATLSGNIVLDFSAPWCPSCRAFEKHVMENASSIPSDLTIVKVDYDSMKDLKTKYGVRVQHTFVQVDSAGNKIGLWTGGSTIDSVVAKLK